MNSNGLTQTIVTGSDPRGLPEFSAIREEINKASHPSQPELNWKLVESLALAIFKANGGFTHRHLLYACPDTDPGTGGILRRCGTAGGNGKPRLG